MYYLYISILCVLFIAGPLSSSAQDCNLNESDQRRTQVTEMTFPYSAVVHMGMKRLFSFSGTSFLIHPRVLLTAGHNVRRTGSVFRPRVTKLHLAFGSSAEEVNLYSTTLRTVPEENMYTLPAFNDDYSILTDYGIIILPDSNAYRNIQGVFKLVVADTSLIRSMTIRLSGYPRDRTRYTQWHDATTQFYFYRGYLHYDFSTEHGVSGAPVWYDQGGTHCVFAIHTNGDYFDDRRCNTATLITQPVYDDIVRFCLTKGIDIR